MGILLKKRFNKKLDELRAFRENSRLKIMNMEMLERKNTGINSLKIKYNNV